MGIDVLIHRLDIFLLIYMCLYFTDLHFIGLERILNNIFNITQSLLFILHSAGCLAPAE